MRDAWQTIKGARRVAPLLLLLLTGCGSDPPYSGPPPGQSHQAPAPTATLAATPTATVIEPPDPLMGDRKQAPADPLIGHDPLLGHDTLRGPAMPTDHSHWLRGRLRDARVTVSLNGVWYGSFSGALDRDITMSLRRGANTVKFVYQPSASSSSGTLNIVEGEHHPPLAPLVTFRSQSNPEAGGLALKGDSLKPVVETYPFIAN